MVSRRRLITKLNSAANHKPRQHDASACRNACWADKDPPISFMLDSLSTCSEGHVLPVAVRDAAAANWTSKKARSLRFIV
jgi:hypothetical protein